MSHELDGPFDVPGGFYIGDDVELSNLPGLPPPVYGRVTGRDSDTLVRVMLDNGCGYATRAENLTRVDRTRTGATSDRDRIRRLFNRLEAAVTRHRNAHVPGGGTIFEEDADTALWDARDKVLKDFAKGKG